MALIIIDEDEVEFAVGEPKVVAVTIVNPRDEARASRDDITEFFEDKERPVTLGARYEAMT